jgi:nucleoside-diphosphate-sugar epimerase
MEVLDHVADLVGSPLCIRRVPARSGDQRRTEACIDKARRLLSVSPSTPLREGIAAEVGWIQREMAAESS